MLMTQTMRNARDFKCETHVALLVALTVAKEGFLHLRACAFGCAIHI